MSNTTAVGIDMATMARTVGRSEPRAPTPALSRAAMLPNARQCGTAIGRRLEQVVRRHRCVHQYVHMRQISCREAETHEQEAYSRAFPTT